MTTKEVINFSAGPAKLPQSVLQRAQKEFLSFGTSGVSVLEMSHRSPDFSRIISSTEKGLRELLDIPSNYKVLFKQGGGTGQFAAVPLNLITLKSKHTADYVVTGSWSAKAAKEASKYGKVHLAFPNSNTLGYTTIPDESSWKLDVDHSYVHYCANETIHGVEFHNTPDSYGVPLVADMSSNIMSRPLDITKFGLIYASAQKNIGPSGATLVIIREDLLGNVMKECPSILCYATMAGNNSLYNTPPTFGIYMIGLVCDWIKEQGGLDTIGKHNDEKARMIYDVIDSSGGFYRNNIDKFCRSRMNVPFRILEGEEKMEHVFLDEAKKSGMIQLKGHRSVGGMRVSLYNAITVDEAKTLRDFMEDFQHQKEAK